SDLGINWTPDLGIPPSDASIPGSDLGGAEDGAQILDLTPPPPDLTPAPPPPDLTTPPPADLSQSICPPGEDTRYFSQGGAPCCLISPPRSCLAPGTSCPDHTVALLPPGGCCAVCD